MGKNRLEAFSDGVLAIIITIMAAIAYYICSPSSSRTRAARDLFSRTQGGAVRH